MGLSLLAQAKMPLIFWWDAFKCAAHLINRTPTQPLQNNIPYQLLFNQNLTLTFLEFLVVHVIHFLDHTILRKYISIHKNVNFLVTILITRDTSVFIIVVEYAYPKVSHLMSLIFLLTMIPILSFFNLQQKSLYLQKKNYLLVLYLFLKDTLLPHLLLLLRHILQLIMFLFHQILMFLLFLIILCLWLLHFLFLMIY